MGRGRDGHGGERGAAGDGGTVRDRHARSNRFSVADRFHQMGGIRLGTASRLGAEHSGRREVR